MNIHQANNLDFPDLLSKLGHEPAKSRKGGHDLWYYSPFRKETEPSFHIRPGERYDWVWHDFGQEGTTILEFIMQYKNKDKKGALEFLDTLYPNYKSRVGEAKHRTKDTNQSSFSFPPQSPAQPSKIFSQEPERELEFLKALPLSSKFIFSYLEGRRIPRELAQKYFRLIHYQNRNKPLEKPYFGFGMKNLSGGWEVRSASDEPGRLFKSALIARDISVIKGLEQGRGAVSVFEGQLDFVSLLVMLRREQLAGDAIILHGLQCYGRAKDYIKAHGYARIDTFLDNNPPGQEKTQEFIHDFGGIVHNQSPRFLPHIDLNDALRAGSDPFGKPNAFPIP